MTASKPKVRIRMYRQGLGDCFLLTFYTGPKPVHMLVDCGTLGATTNGVDILDVVNDIAAATGSHLHLLVATHEHKDHLSGFNTGRAVFDTFQVDNVWVAWTENGEDPLARDVKQFNNDLLTSLLLASAALRARDESLGDELRAVGSGVNELLAFNGDFPADGTILAADFAKTVHEAMSYVTRRAGWPPQFLSPGAVIEPPWLPGVRFYVLGPPRSKVALAELGEHTSPELYHLAAALARDLTNTLDFAASARALDDFREGLSADGRAEFEAGLPFDPCFRIERDDTATRARYFAAYDDPKEAWRRIDHEWLRVADDLALQIDNATNNTSLVLAIELIADGRVLLLPGDAQLGNWRSWQDVTFSVAQPDGTTRPVGAAELLKRTIFYKVGHHASHNATMKENGLEAMSSPDLVAMIPVDRKVALGKKPHQWVMPADALYQRLVAKTNGRVVRSDTGWKIGENPPPGVPQATLDEARKHTPNMKVSRLYIEYRLH
jgi:hypothetical protein